MKKNFKRLLCLVLVVSLVCSLAVTASAASLSGYTDVDEIQYVEAVDLLTGIGILEGTDNAFNPSDNMTRAQAAKIIAYLALGAETASSLSATSAPFDDVPLSHWAVGYIAYCASAGIVDGDGTGNFNPEDEVTAYQFGKMLLCTVGYGVNGEFTGASWPVNVAATAGALGIYSGKNGSLNGNTAITRDEMALYTFNTLTGVAQVNYNSNFGEYYVGTSALNSISTTIKDKYKYEDYIDSDEYDETAYEYTIAYKTYDLTKSGEKGDEAKTDAFGRPSYKWESDGSEVSDEYVDDTPDYTFTGKKESQDVYSEVGRTISDYYYIFYVDGDELTEAEAEKYYDTYGLTNPTKNDDTTMVQRGQIMELYVDDSTYTVGGVDYAGSVRAVIINYYLAQVTDVDADGGEIELTLDAYLDASGSPDTLTIDDSKASNLAGFAEDDWVIITHSEDTEEDLAQSVVAATVLEGVVTASTGTSKTIDGTKYNNSYNFYYNMPDDWDDYDATYVWYLDPAGNLVGHDDADESTSSTSTKNYLYVESVKASGYDDFDDAEVKMKVQFTDGSEETIYLKVTDAGKDSAYVKIAGIKYELDGLDEAMLYYSGTSQTYDEDDTPVAGQVYSYSKNSSGYYTLSAVKYYDDSSTSGTARQVYGVAVDDDTSAVKIYDANGNTDGTYYANSSTKLILVDDGKTYTGYSNFPNNGNYTDSQTLLITSSSGGTRLNYIYVFDDKASATGDFVYAVYTGAGDVSSTTDGETAQFWVNGEKVTYEFDDGEMSGSGLADFTAGWIDIDSDGTADFYSYKEYGNKYDEDNFVYLGVVTDKSSDSLTVEAAIDTDDDGDVDTVVSYNFALADGYEKTRLKAGGSGSASSASEGDYIWIFTEDEVDDNYTSEAVAIAAAHPDSTKASKMSAAYKEISEYVGYQDWLSNGNTGSFSDYLSEK